MTTTIEAQLPEVLAEGAGAATPATMHALVYHGPGKRAWEEKPRPTVTHPSDAIVRDVDDLRNRPAYS